MLRSIWKFLTLGGFGSYHRTLAAEQAKLIKDHERMAKQSGGNIIRNIGPGVRVNAGEITDPTLEPRKDFFRTPQGDIYEHVARHAFSNEMPPMERSVGKPPLLGAPYGKRDNPLVEMYDENHHRFFWDLLDLLGKREITLYGLSLAPKDIQTLRHNLRRLGYDPREMQKIVTEPKR